MDIAICDSLLTIGGEVTRDVASDLYFQNDKIVGFSQMPAVRDLNVKNRIVPIKSLIDIEKADVFIVTHDNDLTEKIDLFKKRSTYIIEVLSTEVGSDLFIFPVQNIKNILTKKHFWIPNSFTISIASICKEIGKVCGLKSIFASGYNSASNEKGKDINNLYNDTRSFFEASVLNNKADMNEKERLAFNCIPKIGDILSNGSTSVEDKIEKECKYFFQENNIKIDEDFEVTVNLNKVPVFRGDSYFVRLELNKEVNQEEIEDLLDSSENIVFSKEEFMTQAEVMQNTNIFVSRLKCKKNYISFYLTIDNIKICTNNAVNLLKLIKAGQMK